jgi:hypothetical protein
MLSVLVAALVVAASPPDTVFTVDGGRITGSVMEESATAGVTIQTPDGSVRRIDRGQVLRIEYADGTISPARPPPPATPAATPHPKPEAPQDILFFVGGGRVRGTVIEENPRSGVRVRQLDGTYQAYPRDDIARIEYADGTVSVIAPPPAPEPAAAPEPKKPLPVYFTLGLGATFLGGDATRQVTMSDRFALEQAHVSGELALRLSPAWALGVYGDAGGGDPSSAVGKQCDALNATCTAATGRVGFLIRHTWDPISSRPIWLTLGTGWEMGTINIDYRGTQSGSGSGSGSGSSQQELLRYTGRELLRVGTGIDFRLSRIVGFGLYGSFAFGRYDTLKDQVTTVSVDQGTHTTAQVGVRLILFP